MIRKLFRCIAITLGVFLSTTACFAIEFLGNKRMERSERVFDQKITITVYDTSSSKDTVRGAIGEAFSIMREIEQKIDPLGPDSPDKKINALRIGENSPFDHDLLAILSEADRVSKLSQGAYDIAALRLRKGWQLSKEQGRYPTDEEIRQWLPAPNYKDILIDPLTDKLTIEKNGFVLDWQMPATAYAVELAADRLKKRGIHPVTISADGLLKLVGGPPGNGRFWRIAIEHPREKDEYAAILELLGDTTIVSANDYDNAWIYNNKRLALAYPDPRTGKIPGHRLASAIVITKNALQARLLATALFVLGSEKAFPIAESVTEEEIGLICLDDAEGQRVVFGASENLQPAVKEINL